MAYSVQITSYPEGAKLYLDGKFEDYTNWWLHGLEGNHTIKLTLSGYPDWSCTITPSDAGKTIYHAFKPLPIIKVTINWEAWCSTNYPFFVGAYFGKDTNGTIEGFDPKYWVAAAWLIIAPGQSTQTIYDIDIPPGVYDTLVIIRDSFSPYTMFDYEIKKNTITIS